MTEEERKAVEILNTFEFRGKTRNYKEISLEDSKSVKIVLNLLEKLQKENEELKADNYELNNRITDLLENIPIQKVKDKIKEEKMPLTIAGGIRNKKILEYGISLGRMQVLQELIGEREENKNEIN